MSRKRKRHKIVVKPTPATVTVEAPVSTPSQIASSPTMTQRVMEKLMSIGVVGVAPKREATSPVPVPTPAAAADKTKQRAIQNQQHYLKLAANGDRPWFQYPKFDYQYSEFVMVTPEMAQTLMEYNSNVRSVKSQHVAACARDIINDRWLQTSECIDIDVQGYMSDGQHRALAIIEAKKPVPMYITFNVPVESRFVIDSGAKRTVNEKLKLVTDVNLGNRGAALCRAMMGGVSNRIRYSESEIAEFAMKHEETLRWVTKHMPNVRADVQAVIGKAYLWYGENAIKPFCERFRTMNFCGQDDPATLLYKFLERTKSNGGVSGVNVYKKTLAVIEHVVANRQVRALYERDQDIFEWLPGWNVPQKASPPEIPIPE